jgi:hypothetical protein
MKKIALFWLVNKQTIHWHFTSTQYPRIIRGNHGEMAEWLNAPVLKTGKGL